MKPGTLKPWELRRALFYIGASHEQDLRDEKVGMLLTDLLNANGAWTRAAVVGLLSGVHGEANAASALKAMTEGCHFHMPLATGGAMPFAYWCLHFNRVDVLAAVAALELKFPRESETGSTTVVGEALDQMSCMFAAPVCADPSEPLSSKPGRRWSFVQLVEDGPPDTSGPWPAETLDACAELMARVDPKHSDIQALVATKSELGARFARALMVERIADTAASENKRLAPQPRRSMRV